MNSSFVPSGLHTAESELPAYVSYTQECQPAVIPSALSFFREFPSSN